MAKTEAVVQATGRSKPQWFAALDRWGAQGRAFREISAWLTNNHGVSKWWAQKIIVEYEEARGIRPPGIRPNGTFEVSASRTVEVPLQQLFDAFVEAPQRKRWLTDGKMSLRDSQPARAARFAWDDGSTRVTATFTTKGRSKSAVSVAHDRLPTAGKAATTKTRWRQRLADLKEYLES